MEVLLKKSEKKYEEFVLTSLTDVLIFSIFLQIFVHFIAAFIFRGSFEFGWSTFY